jgi:hypothetical protein
MSNNDKKLKLALVSLDGCWDNNKKLKLTLITPTLPVYLADTWFKKILTINLINKI